MAASPSGAVPDFEEKLRERWITLWLVGLNPVPLEVIRRSPLGATLARERMFYNLLRAAEAHQEMNSKRGGGPNDRRASILE